MELQRRKGCVCDLVDSCDEYRPKKPSFLEKVSRFSCVMTGRKIMTWKFMKNTVKLIFFAYPLFREPSKFAKITGRENLNTVAFQCSRKQKR